MNLPTVALQNGPDKTTLYPKGADRDPREQASAQTPWTPYAVHTGSTPTGLDILALERLFPVETVRTQLPVAASIRTHIEQTKARITDLLLNKTDRRLLVIVGPCSIHDPAAALIYAERLSQLRTVHAKQLEIIMRVYLEKPRTTEGWKGFLTDPDRNNTFNINKGVQRARQLLLDINALGLPTGTEFLDPITTPYISDLMSWGAIGARSVEDQLHRNLASGLSMPIGFKNGTQGRYDIAIGAMRSARAPTALLLPNAHGELTIYRTAGNLSGHLILRGGKKPNYDQASIGRVTRHLRSFHLPERVIVDCSHGNAEHNYLKQIDVAASIGNQLTTGNTAIAGIMVESFLTEGKQEIPAIGSGSFGQSVTDPCLGWDQTDRLLERLAHAVKKSVG